MSFRRLSESVLVAGQIGPGDVTGAAAAGVTLIVNNRPDGEEPGQPTGESIAAAALAAGLDYRHIPVSGGISPDQIAALADAIAAAEGTTLAFCRSGTRSTYLWALARARQGDDPDSIIAAADAAGYDLSTLRPYLG